MKIQPILVICLLIVIGVLLRWTPPEHPTPATTTKTLVMRGAQASPKPPVSIEWTGRPSQTVNYEDGVNVEVYRHDFIGSTLWLDFWDRVNGKRWERETLWIFKWYLTRDPKSVLVDFGSWIGPTVLYGGNFASKIYSLEPDPLSFSTLNGNINLNKHIAEKTHVYFECIAPKTGPVDMSGSGESNTRMVDVLDTKFLKAGTRWTVQCRTLPQFLKDENVDMDHLQLIKMDTEGTELWLLPSLKDWLMSLKKKPAIWLSVHSPFWKNPTAEEQQAAWDVLSLWEFVYNQDLIRFDPKAQKPDWCPDFCTFLLSDVRYEGQGAKNPF